MSGVIKGIGKGIGKVAGLAAPFASFIPGAGPLISAGLGAAGSLLGGPGGTQTQTGIDPFIDPFRQDMARRAQQFGTGSFDPASIQQFMNPFQQQVEAATMADFGRQRARYSNSAADQATQAGAFGGSRQAVLEARGLAELDQAEAGTLANLRFGGYQDSMNRAQAEPFQRLGFYRDTLQGLPQSQTLTTRETGGGLNRALGGAAAGLGFYDMLRRRGGPQIPAPRAPNVVNTTRPQPSLRPAPSYFPQFSR